MSTAIGAFRRAGRAAAFWVVTAVAGIAIVLGTWGADHGQDPARPLDGGAYALMGAAILVLLGRRRWPGPTLAATVAVTGVYLLAGYALGPIFLAPFIAMGSVATRWPVRRSLAACVASVTVLFAGHTPSLLAIDPADLLGRLGVMAAFATGWLVLPWGVGTVLQLAREDTARAREEDARRRAYEERLRVAREVHDVVGHGLAVISLQAGIALHVLRKRRGQAAASATAGAATTNGSREPDLDGGRGAGAARRADAGRAARTAGASAAPATGGAPALRTDEEVEGALEAIKTASKDALEELRRTLAVFRRPDPDAAARRPVPGLGQIDALIADMADAGLPVTLTVEGERPDLPGSIDLAAYRIVQESLTNVLRHAGPEARARVRVGYRDGELALDISDDGRGVAAAGPPRAAAGTGGGHGIVGMRERAAAVGGSLAAGPRPGGGFGVHARLPVGGGA